MCFMESMLSNGPLCACPAGPEACSQPYCPYVPYAMELLGRRWTASIMWALLSGITRFTDMRDTIPDLSDRMLSERLKELETEGIVVRRVIAETPVRIEYGLTPRGHALQPLLRALLRWCGDWSAADR